MVRGSKAEVATEWLPGAGLFCALPAHTSLFSVLMVSSNPSSKAAYEGRVSRGPLLPYITC